MAFHYAGKIWYDGDIIGHVIVLARCRNCTVPTQLTRAEFDELLELNRG